MGTLQDFIRRTLKAGEVLLIFPNHAFVSGNHVRVLLAHWEILTKKFWRALDKEARPK